MRLARIQTARTHEGARAKIVGPEETLRRAVMTALLWEDTFYVDGESVAKLVKRLVPQVAPERVAAIAREARHRQHIRHMPLFIARVMAGLKTHKSVVADLLYDIIERPDEMAEYLAIYWKSGRRPISAQSKRGLRRAFAKFDAYQLAKYVRRRDAITLRDVMRLVHPKPTSAQAEAMAELAAGRLRQQETWEARLSSGEDKAVVFTDLIERRKIGGLAFLRNLRNMIDAGVSADVILDGFRTVNFSRVLPFRFVSAWRAVKDADVRIAAALEEAFLRSTAEVPRLPGETDVLVDVSGSMTAQLSYKSQVTRGDVAASLAAIIVALDPHARVAVFSDETRILKKHRRGFGLVNEITGQLGGGTYLGRAVSHLAERTAEPRRRLIIITDEQAHDNVKAGDLKKWQMGYTIDVAPYEYGVHYDDRWIHIDGWSDRVIDFIVEVESSR